MVGGMGLHISIMRMPGGDGDSRFDYIRRSGDVAFATTDDIEWLHHPEDDDLRRPVDIDGALRWVGENVQPAGNATRLLAGLDMLKSDENLWMCFSW